MHLFLAICLATFFVLLILYFQEADVKEKFYDLEKKHMKFLRRQKRRDKKANRNTNSDFSKKMKDIKDLRKFFRKQNRERKKLSENNIKSFDEIEKQFLEDREKQFKQLQNYERKTYLAKNTIYLKNPISMECHETIPDHRKILNPINPLQPVIKFGDKSFYSKRGIDNEDFKEKILDVILKDIKKIDLKEPLKELEDPKTNIFEKESWTVLPENEYNKIIKEINSKLSKTFYKYISKLPKNEASIKCPRPAKKNCKPSIIDSSIIKIMENSSYYFFILQITWYIKDKSHAYVLAAEAYCEKKKEEKSPY